MKTIRCEFLVDDWLERLEQHELAAWIKDRLDATEVRIIDQPSVEQPLTMVQPGNTAESELRKALRRCHDNAQQLVDSLISDLAQGKWDSRARLLSWQQEVRAIDKALAITSTLTHSEPSSWEYRYRLTLEGAPWKDWVKCDKEHFEMVKSYKSDLSQYEWRELYTHPAALSDPVGQVLMTYPDGSFNLHWYKTPNRGDMLYALPDTKATLQGGE